MSNQFNIILIRFLFCSIRFAISLVCLCVCKFSLQVEQNNSNSFCEMGICFCCDSIFWIQQIRIYFADSNDYESVVFMCQSNSIHFHSNILILYYMLCSLLNTHVSFGFCSNFLSIFLFHCSWQNTDIKIPLAISIIFPSFDPFHQHRTYRIGVNG